MLVNASFQNPILPIPMVNISFCLSFSVIFILETILFLCTASEIRETFLIFAITGENPIRNNAADTNIALSLQYLKTHMNTSANNAPKYAPRENVKAKFKTQITNKKIKAYLIKPA